MPRASWPLLHDRPIIQINISLAVGGRFLTRNLLADSGAGTLRSGFEIVLDENDCLQCGGVWSSMASLTGAFSGSFPVYFVRVCIPQLGFDHRIRAVGVPSVPKGLDGIACFRFLSRFIYGNFARSPQFGLEV
jgi:hypothetical protein